MEKIIKDLIQSFDGLSYINVEDSGEGKLFGISVDYFDTLKLNKEQYEDVCQVLDSVDIIKDNYQIYCSYDKSGYVFWTKREESICVYIDIWISDDFTDDDIDSLYESLREVNSKIDKTYIKFLLN